MTQVENARAYASIHETALEDVGNEHGTDGLLTRFLDTISQLELTDEERHLIDKSLRLAMMLHAKDKRTYEPYINHPIRVAIRLIEELGVVDAAIIAAALLHDTVEDHSVELAALHEVDTSQESEELQRQLGFVALKHLTQGDVSNIVFELTNPIIKPGENKNAVYYEHTKKLTMMASLAAVAVKRADVRDNTYQAKGEDPSKRKSLDKKQIPIYPLHLAASSRLSKIIPEEKLNEADRALREAYRLAKGRLGYDMDSADLLQSA